MGAAIPVIMVASAAVGAGAAYMNYRNTADAMAQQNAMATQQAMLMQQQYAMQASLQSQQAAAYSAQAGIAARTGQILQANEMHKAAQAQREGEKKSKTAAERRRLLVGSGKVKFAANGVLLESRPQASVAMWEQDEAADLAFELSGIKQQVDNEVFGYIWNGYNARLQGLFDAQALEMQAGAANANAANSLLQGELAVTSAQATIAQNDAATDSALWGFIGSLANTGGQLASYGARTGGTTATTPESPLVK